MSNPESASKSPSRFAKRNGVPVATFSPTQRRRIRAWAKRRPHWEIEFDVYTPEFFDYEAQASECVLISLPVIFAEGVRRTPGWTLWPSIDERVGVCFDGVLGTAVVPLTEALRDIARLWVYEITDDDDGEAARCVPMFTKRNFLKPPTQGMAPEPHRRLLQGGMILSAPTPAGYLPGAAQRP